MLYNKLHFSISLFLRALFLLHLYSPIRGHFLNIQGHFFYPQPMLISYQAMIDNFLACKSREI